jgi:hypothetical protein
MVGLKRYSRCRSHKRIESDINRNCHENAKKELPRDEPAEENGCRIEKKQHEKSLSRTKGNGNSENSPVQSSQSLNWGRKSLAFVKKRFFREATGKGQSRNCFGTNASLFHKPTEKHPVSSVGHNNPKHCPLLYQETTDNAMHSIEKRSPSSKQTISELGKSHHEY